MATQVTTWYASLPNQLFEQLAAIKLLVCDVDGVFSDGRIYLGNQGEELKAFHTRDGFGVKALVSAGVTVACITGRNSHIVSQRMRALNVAHIIQGQEDKSTALHKLVTELNLTPDEVAAVGDDMPDIGMFAHASVKIAVNDAHPYVLEQANWITTKPGGFGAVREICDTLLQAKGMHRNIHGASV